MITPSDDTSPLASTDKVTTLLEGIQQSITEASHNTLSVNIVNAGTYAMEAADYTTATCERWYTHFDEMRFKALSMIPGYNYNGLFH